MPKIENVEDFVSSFENLSKDSQKELVKKLMPKFCEILMGDKSIIQEIMPDCMGMMKGMNFPMKEMMSKMMGKE
ncbi:MAG: hypothetical protein NC918_02065 [Candidatus Omnitrophica bacterium]|nr:hypothetical protein [Candidatus Omnitrophota bacterium]